MEPSAMPLLADLSLDRFWWVLDEPAPLAGMRLPDPHTDFDAVAKAGFKWVVALEGRGRHDCLPLTREAFYLENLAGGRMPTDPLAEQKLVDAAAGLVVDKLKAGQGVVVHCWGGTGRTGTVIGRSLVYWSTLRRKWSVGSTLSTGHGVEADGQRAPGKRRH